MSDFSCSYFKKKYLFLNIEFAKMYVNVKKNFQMRIVGGENTGLHEFPMMAGIVDSRLSQVYCGGTIISVKHVLSAAHCVMNRDPSFMGVLIGDHDISTGISSLRTNLR